MYVFRSPCVSKLNLFNLKYPCSFWEFEEKMQSFCTRFIKANFITLTSMNFQFTFKYLIQGFWWKLWGFSISFPCNVFPCLSTVLLYNTVVKLQIELLHLFLFYFATIFIFFLSYLKLYLIKWKTNFITFLLPRLVVYTVYYFCEK